MSSKACDANDITVSNSRIDRLFCFWAMMFWILNLTSSNLIWASHVLFNKNKDQCHLSRKQKHFYNTINLFIITLTIKNKNLTFSNFTSASIDLCQSQKNIFSKHSCLMITIVIFSKPIHITLTLTLPYLLPFTICKK
jgi:hypothetical protein